MKTINRILQAAVVLAAFTACADYDNGYEERQLAFEKGFDEFFGAVDPNHTWNTAVQNQVTVKIPEGQYTVKMYTENPRYQKSRAYMLAQYDNVNGGTTRTFNVDMPANLGTVYVGLINNAGDRIILPAQIDGDKASVKFPKISETKVSSRTIFTPADEKMGYNDTYITWGESTDTWIFGYEDVRAALATLPEGKNNYGKVSQNLCYMSMGKFTIYPMHYVSNNSGLYNKGDVFGVYYYDNLGNKHDIDIWQRNNDWHEAFVTNSNGSEVYNGETGYWNCVYPMESTSYYDIVDGVPTGFKSDYKAIRSTGITINLPVGTKFGFYIGTSDNGGTRLYSESALNEGQPSYDGVQSYAASFHEDGELFLCFEDWHYTSSGSDRDFNDIVFGFHGSEALPVLVDKDVAVETMSYIVACEDLGTVGSVDFDFNDVVFGIMHASGQETAKIQLRAAGGTCPVSISYDGTPIKFNNKYAGSGETSDIHAAFGYETDLMINTNYSEGVSADFVMSQEFSVDPNAFTVTNDASKFAINVTYKDDSKAASISVPDLSLGNNSGAQAFLVADPEWLWPSEKQIITSAYPEFTDWVSNHLRSNWYDSVWKTINETKSVPASATDIKTNPGSITYNTSGNVATVTIPKACFGDEEAYQLVIKPTNDCNVSFALGSSTWGIMPSGTVQAGRVTTFTFHTDAIAAVKRGSDDVVVTFTFADGVTAADKIETLYWSGAAAGGNIDPSGPDYGTAVENSYGTYDNTAGITVAIDEINKLNPSDESVLEITYVIDLDEGESISGVASYGTEWHSDWSYWSKSNLQITDLSIKPNTIVYRVNYSDIKNYSHVLCNASAFYFKSGNFGNKVQNVYIKIE